MAQRRKPYTKKKLLFDISMLVITMHYWIYWIILRELYMHSKRKHENYLWYARRYYY